MKLFAVSVPGPALAARLSAPLAVLALASATMTGCGGGTAKADAANKVSRASASSLQQAMTAAARAVDGVRGSRASLEHLSASLQSAEDQTGDVISLLTPRATDSEVDAQLLKGARDQRSFLQYAQTAANARSRGSGLSAVANARNSGGKAASDYQSTAVNSEMLAGLLPTSTSFATGRLRDAVLAVTKPKSKSSSGGGSKSSGGGGGGGGGGGVSAPVSSGAGCGNGVSVNSATSCPFGRNVAEAYDRSGGSSSIDVYSPVTKQSYTMYCSGSGPVTCTGGNNAVVQIR